MARREAAGTAPDFEDLYRRYYAGVVRHLTFLLGDRAVAEEVTQETFLKLYTQLPPRAENLQGWLLQVGSRLALNALRGEKRRRRREENVARAESWEAPLEEAVLRQEAVQRVRQVLDELPVRDRLALLLRHSDFSYREIAAILDVAVGSVGTILARAQRSFLAHYRQRRGGEDDGLL